MKKLIPFTIISLAVVWAIPFTIDYFIFESQASLIPTGNVEWVPTIWSWAVSLGLTLTLGSTVSIFVFVSKTPGSPIPTTGSKPPTLVSNGDYLISPSEEMSGSPSRHEPPASPPSATGMSPCPSCGKLILPTVRVCPFCQIPVKKK